MHSLRATFQRSNPPDFRCRFPRSEYACTSYVLRFGQYEESQPGRELWNETSVVDRITDQVIWRTNRPSRLIGDYSPWSANESHVAIVGETSLVLELQSKEEHPLKGDVWFARYSPSIDRLLSQSALATLHCADGSPLIEFPNRRALGWTRENRFMLVGPDAEIFVHDGLAGAPMGSLKLDALQLFPIDEDTRSFMESADVTITSMLPPRHAKQLVSYLEFIADPDTGDLLVGAVRPADREVRTSGRVRSVAGQALWVRATMA